MVALCLLYVTISSAAFLPLLIPGGGDRIQGLMHVKKHHQAHISTGHFQGDLACGGEAQEMSNQWWVGLTLSDSVRPKVEAVSCRGFWLTSSEI